MAIGSALSVGLIGLKAFIVQIQAFVSPGLPYFSIIGLPDHLIVRGARTGQVGMPGKWFQMAGNPCHGQSLPSVHAEERLFA